MAANPASGDKGRNDGEALDAGRLAGGKPPEPAAFDPALLEQVLSETVTNEEAVVSLEPGEMNALLEVARRHAGQPLTLDPVVVELVEALLVRRFAEEGGGDFWKHLAKRIATTLMDDPPTQDRLATFWARLRERAK